MPEQHPQTSAPALELDDIQGDILIGLQKDFERFVFFEILDATAFKANLREKLTLRIIDTTTVQSRESQLRERKRQGNNSALPNVGVNVGFTNTGLQKLRPGDDLKDVPFVTGAQARAAGRLGDPINGAGPATWRAEFLSGKID